MPVPARGSNELGPLSPAERRARSFEIREQAASYYRAAKIPAQLNNGDEEKYRHQNYYASFSKGLPHDANGEVDPHAYRNLLAALKSGDGEEFENIPMGSPANQRLKLVDPQCGLAFDLEGIDSHQLTLPPAYTFDSEGEIGEIAENYWMALCRDIPFVNYDSDPTIAAAAADLSKYSQFDGPKAGGAVTPQTVFRGLAGDTVGPYLSQFMILPIPYGSQRIAQQIAFGVPPTDYLTSEADWLAVQNGISPAGPPIGPLASPNIVRNGRDLGQYVHVDELFQAYLNTCLLLITPPARGGFGAALSEGNPYVTSLTQTGFGTLGEPNFKTLVAEVATRALKAVWYQKWYVHRRLRPEAFGGRIHFHFAHNRDYDFQAAELAKLAAGPLPIVRGKYGSWLLPMAFPEGCPVHPAYGAGHATVAGACITVLKALFREEQTLVGDLGVTPMVPDSTGASLTPYTGADAAQLTVGSELNKIASNIGLARNFAGVHWRSDYTESVQLGEEVALYFLKDQATCFHEEVSFSITRLDGTKVTIQNTF